MNGDIARWLCTVYSVECEQQMAMGQLECDINIGDKMIIGDNKRNQNLNRSQPCPPPTVPQTPSLISQWSLILVAQSHDTEQSATCTKSCDIKQ